MSPSSQLFEKNEGFFFSCVVKYLLLWLSDDITFGCLPWVDIDNRSSIYRKTLCGFKKKSSSERQKLWSSLIESLCDK